MIHSILPPSAAAIDAVGDVTQACLLPEEEAALGPVSEARRRQFTIARHCARQALERLGAAAAPILCGPGRQPIWPAGIVGSITHCRGYCAAAVAFSTELAAIGIDAEPHCALPDGVIELVAREEERIRIGDMDHSTLSWETLLFSAKESVFKAWFPLTGQWLGFHDVRVRFDPVSEAFVAEVLIRPRGLRPHAPTEFRGRYAAKGNFLLTTVSESPLATA